MPVETTNDVPAGLPPEPTVTDMDVVKIWNDWMEGGPAKVVVEPVMVTVCVLAPAVPSLAPAWKLYRFPPVKLEMINVVLAPPTTPTEELVTVKFPPVPLEIMSAVPAGLPFWPRVTVMDVEN